MFEELEKMSEMLICSLFFNDSSVSLNKKQVFFEYLLQKNKRCKIKKAKGTKLNNLRIEFMKNFNDGKTIDYSNRSFKKNLLRIKEFCNE